MTAKNKIGEDGSMLFFQDVDDSPCKSDASSVDIYDGLDMSAATEEVSGRAAPLDCLDLYEEIITEEGAVREASFNDLHAEYDKCQKQMKELISKFKEMQSQNTCLQNENQCLKKNISALIKTARVEITRKEEEINRLNQRLFGPLATRNIKPNPVPLESISKTSCTDGTQSKDTISRNIDHSLKTELKHQGTSSKGTTSSCSPKNASEKDRSSDSGESSTSCTLKTPYVKLCKENVESHLQKQVSDSHSDVDEKKTRKEKEMEYHHKDSDRRPKKEDRRHSIGSSANEKKIVKLKQKSHVPSSDPGKPVVCQETKKAQSDLSHEMDNRKYFTSTPRDKSSTMKEKMQLRDEPRSKERLLKTNEKSPNTMEPKVYEKDRKSDGRNRSAEKEGYQPRRSKRTSISQLDDETDKSSHKSVMCEQNDMRRSNDAGSRREKRSSEYYKDSKSSLLSSKEMKTSTPKYDDKHVRENKSVKSEKDKRHDEKKRSRENQDGSRHLKSDRRGHKEHTEADALTLMSSSEGKNVSRTGEQFKSVESRNVVDCKKDKLAQNEVNTQKDMKLSFMETLSLTLSPDKNISVCELNSNIKSSKVSYVERSITAPKEIQEASLQVCESIASVEKKESTSQHLCSPKEIASRMDVLVSEEATLADAGILQKLTSEMCVSETITGATGCQQEKELTATVNETITLPTPTNLPTTDNEDVALEDDLETVSSEELETLSVIDVEIVELDSFIEIDKWSGSISPQGNADKGNTVLTKPCQAEDVGNNASRLHPNITQDAKGIFESSNSDLIDISTKRIEYKQYFHDDESSVMSIDLNVMRCIPKAISPLTSPVRPLVKLHTIEGTSKASVVRVLSKELSEANTGSTWAPVSNELNKENCQPEYKTGTGCGKYFHLEMSSDEVEEGEIISDDEENCKSEEAPTTAKSPKRKGSSDQENACRSPETRKKEVASLAKTNGVISSPKQSAYKVTEKNKTCTKLLKLPKKAKKLNEDSCLEGILKIVHPSTVQDVLQMLRVIRKHIRKKYMKFKMQFSLRQFLTVIETATLCFVKLVKSLDWSKMCSSPDSLKRKLCKTIESKLKRLQKNGIVDHIFDQHLIDMKKKLWRFVDNQLDICFVKLEAVLTKLCNKAKMEGDIEGGVEVASVAKPRTSSVHVKHSKKRKTKCKKKQLSIVKEETTFEPCLRPTQLEASCETQVSSDAKLNVNAVSHSVTKKLSFSMEAVKESAVVWCDSRNEITLGKSTNPKSKDSSNTSAIASRDQESQNTSSLSFNLVSDDHMGAVFKSLLHDSDPFEQSKSLEEKLWVCKTPEKLNPSLECENVVVSSEATTLFKAAWQLGTYSWPHLSSEQPALFSRMQMPLNPDVLDESCMMEIPTSASPGKSITGSEERTKSYVSSILMEDLAVSLTVPSPLKSDSHLSFLRPVSAPDSTLEEIISAHYSEDALFEGEGATEQDATEQDIHLILDSDNSSSSISSCSFANPGEPPGFQYHPSEPMQAVIMEKSNDHFIVKIRRAVSATSPTSDCSSSEQMTNFVPELVISEVDGEKVQHNSSKETTHEEGRNLEIHGNETISETESNNDKPEKTDPDLPKVEEFLGKSIVNVEHDPLHFKQQLPISVRTPETTDTMLQMPEAINDIVKCTYETLSASEIDKSSPVGEGKSVTQSVEMVKTNLSTCTTQTPVIVTKLDCRDKSLDRNVKKRKKTLKEEPLTKRKRDESLLVTETQRKLRRHGKKADEDNVLVMERNFSTHTESASDGAIQLSPSKSSPNSMSAKNIIKKKGEVVASWSRDEDRVILLDCQKLGPHEKTFLSLSSKLNKYPYQIEERFQQLMKLFKKCTH
ncbi:CASP8-associated protein 2 isoform X2 [Ascaphus truei]